MDKRMNLIVCDCGNEEWNLCFPKDGNQETISAVCSLCMYVLQMDLFGKPVGIGYAESKEYLGNKGSGETFIIGRIEVEDE